MTNTTNRPQRVDPAVAFHMDWRTLRGLMLGYTTPDNERDVREQFARHLRSHPAATWQEGWNEFVGKRGNIEIPARKCTRCNGMRVDVRRGGAPCQECRGRGRIPSRLLRGHRADATQH